MDLDVSPCLGAAQTIPIDTPWYQDMWLTRQPRREVGVDRSHDNQPAPRSDVGGTMSHPRRTMKNKGVAAGSGD